MHGTPAIRQQQNGGHVPQRDVPVWWRPLKHCAQLLRPTHLLLFPFLPPVRLPVKEIMEWNNIREMQRTV